MMARKPKQSKSRTTPPQSTGRKPVGVRIIGGKLRGRKIRYGGDNRVRPMKDRARESLFNLIGPAIQGKHAVDLFAGTGALGLEAISRGAIGATFIEQHYPTARILRENVASLGVAETVDAVTADVFIWFHKSPKLPKTPWAVFCSPPYDLYVKRPENLLSLVAGLMETAPAESIFAVESDNRFDFSQLPHAGDWDVRTYRPAVIGVYRKPNL